MPVASSGRIVKSSKKKGGTQHHKNHRWESFTSKLSKFSSLDPLRRVRRHDLDSENLEKTTSYLRNGLDKWQELNLSARFIEFSRALNPLCDSLAQIIHFEDQIFELFSTYLEEQDRESLEPLLALLTDFAHDLGVRFEKHYGKALQLVTSIASTFQDVEVIEWSFTCLAFLFKYLSRLLVSDLRPTYDLMAPLLGKTRQPPHIARFAAEALSFLVKKAAAPAVRETALDKIVSHSTDDLLSIKGSRQFKLYYHGIMTMFAEAIKGNNLTIHSTGPAILKSLLGQFRSLPDEEDAQDTWADVVYGVLTSLVHHTSPDTCKDVLEVVLEHCETVRSAFSQGQTTRSFRDVLLSLRMVGTVVGVRKGSRIGDWHAILQSLSLSLEAVSKDATSLEKRGDSLWQCAVQTVALTLQYAPMDALIPFVSNYMSVLIKEPLAIWFLQFSYYFSKVDSERFQSIVFPYFQRFIVAHWSDADNEDALCLLLPKMVDSGVLPRSTNGKDGFSIPQSWQDRIVSKFEKLESSPFPEKPSPMSLDKDGFAWHDRCLPKYHALLEIFECTAVHPSTNARIAEILLRKLKLALRPSSALALDESHFIVGRAFKTYLNMIRYSGTYDKSLRPLLYAAAPRYCQLPDFLEALLTYETSFEAAKSKSPVQRGKESKTPTTPGADGADLLVESLINNLSTESHDLRFFSLRLLDHIYSTSTGSPSDAIATMLLIEQTPLDLQSARTLSMHIRKLASMYSSSSSEDILSKAIPSFCFGMLTVKFSQTWDDAAAALAQISQVSIGEENVADIAFRWLATPSIVRDGPSAKPEDTTHKGLTDFECSNLMNMYATAKDVGTEIQDCHSILFENFKTAQSLIPAQPVVARTQALKVLKSAPNIAERRSRQLVPMFLSWARHDDDSPRSSPEENPVTTSNWIRKDQKELLDLFHLFTNPKVLFRSVDVYSALLNLLCNGDLDIQKSALKAIFTWKISSVRPYEENLLNLLDEDRFKDEVTVLLQNETRIQVDHRAELMPILLRVLYGRTIAKKGAGSGRQGMEGRRLIVIRNLTIEDTATFLDISLGDLKHVDLERKGIFDEELMAVRKLLGFVRMMEDVLKELGNKVEPFTKVLLPAILYCAVFSSRRLNRSNRMLENEDEAEEDISSQDSLLKVVRQTALKCLNLLFQNHASYDWSTVLPVILEELISPRLEDLPVETGQGVSGILQLFSTWSAASATVLFLGRDERILTKIADCLAPPKSKDTVKLFALGIIRNILGIASDSRPEVQGVSIQVQASLLKLNVDHFLFQIGSLLRDQQDLSKDLLEANVDTVSELAGFVSESTQARRLVDVSVFLLDQPSRRVNPKTKIGLLKILEHFVPLYDLQDDTVLKDKIYNTITSLFGFFRDKTSREVLSRVLLVYSRKDLVIEEIAGYCLDLNSYAEGRLEEADYDRRLNAYNAINRLRDTPFTPYQWRPLLYNMLYYIRQDEEFGVLSSNASDGICKFLDDARNVSSPEERTEFRAMISDIVLPAIYSGAREPSEVIRREHVKVMAHLVRIFPDWDVVSDMHDLLAGDDELESSFFNNILAVGKGRQFGALHQLSTAAASNQLSSRNVSQFFIPLIEHFIFDRAEGGDAHNLAAETTSTVGSLAASLEWAQYKAILRRFTGYISSKPELEKQIIRLLAKVVDALAEAAHDTNETARSEDKENGQGRAKSHLARSLPVQEKMRDDILNNILPPLTAYLHDKDESTVSLRVPVAIIIVRLLKILPQYQTFDKLAAVLTDICHILRSKAQESRDMARDTLAKICEMLGPSSFGFVLKQLRTALPRGSQLHVLSYTMHTILVAVTPNYSPGDLDYCLPAIVAVIMDDIFGVTGEEKDAEEYTSKMREVKSNKSHDSMELVARTASLNHLIDMVRPIQVLLNEKLNLRMVRKIDELLSRISTGLLKNPAVQSRDSLIFCYEVIQEVYNTSAPQLNRKENNKYKRYLLQPGTNKSSTRGSNTVSTHKLIRFALDALRSILKKYDDLRTPANLTGFIPIFGDAVLHPEDEVKTSIFRLLAIITKVPFKVTEDATNLFQVALKEALQCIALSSSIVTDVAQAALKLISVILRDRDDIMIKDTSLDDLLSKIKDDITDPERRHITFNFLRAVLNAEVETATVYDIMDYVGTVMVTNDDKDTRDLARGAYFHFLRTYPQKRNRWSKQLAFIVANLKYEREGGRLSILEVIHLLLTKSSQDFVQEVSATCFVPLVFVLVNDESEKCRMAAGELVKEIFAKADNEKLQSYITMLRSWLQQDQNPPVLRLAFQSYGFFYESQENADDTDVDVLTNTATTILEEEPMHSDWELVYAALQLISTLVSKFPSQLLAKDSQELWSSIRRHLSYPHIWVKSSASKLMNLSFTDFAQANADSGLKLPLRGSRDLQITSEDIKDLIRKSTSIFRTPGLTEILANEAVKSLVFLGRIAATNNLRWDEMPEDQNDVDGDEEEELEVKYRTALQYVFARLSYILRREIYPPRAPMLIPKTAALHALQVLCTVLEKSTLIPYLETILLPLHNLTDPDIPAPYSTDAAFRAGYEELRTNSQEIMTSLQKSCGTSTYTEHLLKVRQGVKERRIQRSSKRKIEAVSAPEKYGRDKQKKVDRKKERRKEKSQEHRDRRKGY